MSDHLSRQLITLAAVLAMAGCSSGVAPEAQTTAMLTAQEASLASGHDSAPPDEPLLDGAPSHQAPYQEPVLIVPETLAPQRVSPPVQAPVGVQREAARFSCDIEVDRTRNGIRITPVVHADRSMSGEYSLVITKSGGGNSSDISQGGPFDASRGESVSLSSSEFSMERGASFRAVLKVRAGGREICRDVRS